MDRTGKQIERYLTPQALDQVTRGYADHYASLVASACSSIIDSDAPLAARVTAMRMRSYGCSSIWDIVTNPDPFTRLLDLLVVVSLESSIWIDGALADDVFGERADIIVLALRQARERIWKIGERAVNPDVLRQLDGLSGAVFHTLVLQNARGLDALAISGDGNRVAVALGSRLVILGRGGVALHDAVQRICPVGGGDVIRQVGPLTLELIG